MKKVLLIATGGTIASGYTKEGLAPRIAAKDLLQYVEDYKAFCQVDILQPFSLDSTNIYAKHWLKLAELIEEQYAGYDGFVICHGTDTMAYTASMLSFMLQNPPIPIVLTGSQLPLGAPMSDAADNCLCAIEMASSGYSGVFVAFNRKIMLGCRTSKVRTVSFNAFESINYPNVGEFNAFGLQLNLRRDNPSPLFRVQEAYSDRIAVLKLFPGMDPDIFRFLQEHGYEGVYIEGFGLGGVPFLKGDFTAEIRRASDAGMPILVGSQCRYEGSNLRVYETGQRILECGGIPVHNMTQEAVVTKLMWCLGQTKRREDILRFFQQNLVQEVSFS